MHMVIKVLVYAENEEDALGNAEEVLEGLCGEDRDFDYYTLFNNDTSQVSGKARWGDIPAVVLVCDKFGTEKCNACDERFKCYTGKMHTMVDEAMEATKQEFLVNLGQIKKLLSGKTDDELFESGDFKYRCNCCGSYKGPNIWLYDHEGEGIRDHEHLKNVLSKWACNNKGEPCEEYKDLNIYCVPVDVHY